MQKIKFFNAFISLNLGKLLLSPKSLLFIQSDRLPNINSHKLLRCYRKHTTNRLAYRCFFQTVVVGASIDFTLN